MHNKLNLEADGLQQQKTTLSAKNGKLRLQNWKNLPVLCLDFCCHIQMA